MNPVFFFWCDVYAVGRETGILYAGYAEKILPTLPVDDAKVLGRGF